MKPEALGALCGYIEREAVTSVRIIEVIPASHVAKCRAGDGSEFFVATDRHGNVFGWADTLVGAMRDAGTYQEG